VSSHIAAFGRPVGFGTYPSRRWSGIVAATPGFAAEPQAVIASPAAASPGRPGR
jgi:hypothetical protein